MAVKPLSNARSFGMFPLLALLLMILPSYSGAGDRTTPPPAPPPGPSAHPAPPAPPSAPESGRAWLGIVLSEEGEGVTVTEVREGSPAEKAGLQQGDRILEVDSRKIETSRDLRRAMRDLEPGDTVQIRLKRKSQEKSVTATLGKAPENSFMQGPWWSGENTPPPFGPGMLGMTRNYLGVRVLSMTEDLRAYFKAPRGRGILVSRVEEDTPAAKAGLKAGDVIIGLDGKGISDRSDIAEALSDRQPGDKIAVKIVRDGTERTLDVEISERPGMRRHGSFFLPEGDEMDHDGMEMNSPEAQESVRRALEQAQEELQRAMEERRGAQEEASAALRESAVSRQQMDTLRHEIEKQEKAAAALRESGLSQQDMETLRREIDREMENAREELRQASEALEHAPI
jgi:membrane-associated protease RseP (regulator of RpoE activity)